MKIILVLLRGASCGGAVFLKLKDCFVASLLAMTLLGGWASAWADTAAVEDKGKELYRSYGCALCHGWDGRGDGINAQKFDPPPTNFHNPQAYLHGSDKDSLRRSIQYGIKEDSSIMPAFEDIPPEELQQIIAFLQSLQEKSKGVGPT